MARDKHDRLLPIANASISIQTPNLRCLIFTCKIPAKYLHKCCPPTTATSCQPEGAATPQAPAADGLAVSWPCSVTLTHGLSSGIVVWASWFLGFLLAPAGPNMAICRLPLPERAAAGTAPGAGIPQKPCNIPEPRGGRAGRISTSGELFMRRRQHGNVA